MENHTDTHVLEAEKLRIRALLEKDVELLSSLLSERLHFMHASSAADSKHQLLRKIEQGNLIYHAIWETEQQVVGLGDTALLTFRFLADVCVNSQNKTIENRALSVWTKEDGTWRLIAYQPTSLPSPAR